MNLKEQMNGIYSRLSPLEIPWINEKPPDILKELVESGKIPPGSVLEVGCGLGNNLFYLAKKNFQITGVDLSDAAIHHAQDRAAQKGISGRFISGDFTKKISLLKESFDFVFDWEVLHHIFPDQRKTYIQNIASLLTPEGYYLSGCFSLESPAFGGKGKYRKTPIGTELYFSSPVELAALYEPYFAIEKMATVEIKSKKGLHKLICSLLKKHTP